ncbi:S9 family peptidase [Corynebacterium sp. 320]|uniref:alpha/beta hydrolase family protein n=1 Tax=Corynebacterium TaxID=1716 RepID=UPI00125CB05E|nr:MULTISPECIES: alpha/beta fold hydrolase [Corynebacterium]KAB1503957.1 S9 family peptidase [Corynebacterium sp. 320]KAB1552944.1 S9 family peptidase [Corynebacterium sp. 321]KAB1553836.1 S9 family peptidase [Corynebacterium sp. 319]KAB3528093.1 S9 family peptidase [Corynebacterium sp. 250]KAB3540419.1 S9 family peptidase [Corynebacterium sp. 366]
MRHTTSPSLSPDGSAIAYIVREGGYPYAVQAEVTGEGIGTERPVQLPVEGPVTRVLHSPDTKWVACEVSPKGSERLETFIVSTDPVIPDAIPLRHTYDARASLVEWDRGRLAMDVVAVDGVSEARLVDPENSRSVVMDRRLDSMLVASEAGYCLMRVGPRGNRELLLVTPDGQWMPLLPPEPGATTDRGVILPIDEETLVVLVVSDHGADRRRILRIVVELAHDGQPRPVCRQVEELISNPDADVDEFVISEDLSTVAVLWNQAGISTLELLALGEEQRVQVRRAVELPGMVAAHLSITDDGGLLSLTVEGPGLPPTVEVLRIDVGRVEPLDPERTERLEEQARQADSPELVHYTARDGLELSGWLYMPAEPAENRPVYIHLHGGPEGQSRPSHHDVLADLVSAGVTVFTPNIRGSQGNGRAFVHADDRYGRFAAVDDVADTASFLLDANLASPGRIAVGGRSYGGFLALLAAARYPEMFCGVVDACGMTSFETYYESTEPWLASAASPKYGYPMHDAELLLEISPLYKARELVTPILFIHGANDTNVPLQESQQLYDAVVDAGHTPEFLTVPGEGHQFVKPKSRRLIADTMLDFLRTIRCLESAD